MALDSSYFSFVFPDHALPSESNGRGDITEKNHDSEKRIIDQIERASGQLIQPTSAKSTTMMNEFAYELEQRENQDSGLKMNLDSRLNTCTDSLSNKTFVTLQPLHLSNEIDSVVRNESKFVKTETDHWSESGAVDEVLLNLLTGGNELDDYAVSRACLLFINLVEENVGNGVNLTISEKVSVSSVNEYRRKGPKISLEKCCRHIMRLAMTCPVGKVRQACWLMADFVVKRIPQLSNLMESAHFAISAFLAPDRIPVLYKKTELTVKLCKKKDGDVGYFKYESKTPASSLISLFNDLFVTYGRITHLGMIIVLMVLYLDLLFSTFPQFFEASANTLHLLMRGSGPLPFHWRHYIACMV